MRRKRFQRGSVIAQKNGRRRVWVGYWREAGVRKCKTLGRVFQMSKAEAEAVLSAILKEVNTGLVSAPRPVYTFEQYVKDVYLPFARRGWKESTAGTSEQIIKTHLVPELGLILLHAVRRDALQGYLDRKALALSRRAW